MITLESIKTIVLGVVALVLILHYSINGIKNGWVRKITTTMNEAIKYAEANIIGSKEKKEYVLQKVKEKCEELGIPYTLIKSIVSKLIDKIIANYNVIKK